MRVRELLAILRLLELDWGSQQAVEISEPHLHLL